MIIVIFNLLFRLSALQENGLYDVFNDNFPTKRTSVTGNEGKSCITELVI